MRLHEEITLEQALLLKVAIQPTKEDPIVKIMFRASLTREVAEAFGCRELIYAGDVPRSGVDKMDLEGDELDCGVRFEHANMVFDAVASEVGKYVAKLEGEGPKLLFQVTLKSYAGMAAELVEKIKHDPLTVVLKPAQLNLGLQEEPAECPGCVAKFSMKPGTNLHIDDTPCLTRQRAAAEADGDQPETAEGEPAVASAVAMGGTHQKGNPKKHGRRKPQAEEPDMEEAEAEELEDADPFEENDDEQH